MVNEYFELITYAGTLNYYIFELANFCVLATFAMITYKLKYINVNSLIVWVGLFFVPLVLNYFILSPFLFPDQFSYSQEVMSLKSTGQSTGFISNQYGGVQPAFLSLGMNPITLTATILGFAPIPNYMTLTSLAFANKLALFLLFIWSKKYFISENFLLLFFLVPSLVLYSSLSLRDNLVIILSIVFLINVLRGNYLIAIPFLYPLLLLKIQMFVFLLLYLIGRLFFRADKNVLALYFFAFTLLVITLIFQEDFLALLNNYRIGFAAENFDMGNGMRGYAAWAIYGDQVTAYIIINSLPEAIFKSLMGLPTLLLMPLPWNWSNIFYPIQSMESLLLLFMYYWITKRYNLLDNKEYILLSFILAISLMVYSLLVFNEGTFVRYRFTLFYPFLFAIFYLGEQKEALLKK
jgi:hypothetical protein